MNTKKIMETEQLVTQLCHRFTHIFEQIREIKQSRVELEEENKNLQSMIQEESEKFEEAAEAMEKATELLEQKNQELERENSKGAQNEKAQQIKQDLESKKTLLDVAQMKLKDVRGEYEQELGIQQGLQAQKEIVEANLHNIQEKIKEHQEIAVNMENNLGEINLKNEELAEKIKNLILSLEQNEEELKKSMEEKQNNEDDYKANLQEYRDMLNQTSLYQKKTKEDEKAIAKMSDELRSKLKRLEVLIKNKIKLESKLHKLENVRVQFDTISNLNQQIEEENYQLRSKLELYVEPEKPTQSQSQQLNRSSVMRAAGRKSLNASHHQGESDLYKKVKYNVLQTQYLESLIRDQQDKDNQVFKNKKRIQEINAEIQNRKQQVLEKKDEKVQLEEKLQVMKQMTSELGEKYENMCQEYGISPYQQTQPRGNSIKSVQQQVNQRQQQQQQYSQQKSQVQSQNTGRNNFSNQKKLDFSQTSTPSRSASGLKTLE